MSDFGSTPTSNATINSVLTDLPASAVYVPNTAGSTLTAMEGIAVNTDSNSKKSSAGRVGLLDGDDATQGAKGNAAATDSTSAWSVVALLKGLYAKLAGTLTISGAVTTSGTVTEANSANIKTDLDSLVTNTADLLADGDHLATIDTSTANSATVSGATTDAAVIGDNSGSISAKMRGLTKILNDIWDSTNHLFHFNLKQVSGAALSASNPVITEANLQTWLRNGQAFVVATGLVTGASATCGLAIWNAATGKSALIYSIRFLDQQGGQAQYGQIYKVTSNPNLANGSTPVNKNFGSVTTSSMTCTNATSGVNLSGTLLESFPSNSPAVVELVQPGSGYLLPNGSSTGLGIQVLMAGTGGFVQVSVHYVEF